MSSKFRPTPRQQWSCPTNIDISRSDDEKDHEGEDQSRFRWEGNEIVNHRSEFKKKANKRRESAMEKKYEENIRAMRISYEHEKKRFHYREKQQHHKIEKWINKKLWNVDRLETKADYTPKVLSFTSIVQEIGRKNTLASNHDPNQIKQKIAAEFEEVDSGSDKSLVLTSEEHSVDIDTNQYYCETLPSSIYATAHDYRNDADIDDYSQYEADHIIQHFTTFAYHGEDNDGVQL